MKNQDLQRVDILPKIIQLLNGRPKITAQGACFLQKGPSEQKTATLVPHQPFPALLGTQKPSPVEPLTPKS